MSGALGIGSQTGFFSDWLSPNVQLYLRGRKVIVVVRKTILCFTKKGERKSHNVCLHHTQAWTHTYTHRDGECVGPPAQELLVSPHMDTNTNPTPYTHVRTYETIAQGLPDLGTGQLAAAWIWVLEDTCSLVPSHRPVSDSSPLSAAPLDSREG